MGAVAGRLSDLAVVTSDNPRTEPPRQIIDEIVAGMQPQGNRRYRLDELVLGFKGKGYAVITDRRAAIGAAVKASRPGDTLLIAGKGHEPYQVIGHRKLAFDDRAEAQTALAGLSWTGR